MSIENKRILGCEEWLNLSSIDIPLIKARVDSGAKTSSLHAFNIRTIEEEGKNYVRFDVNPIQNNKKVTIRCKAPLLDRRVVKSSSGDSEKRYVIKVPVTLGGETGEIEVTLTNRDSMGYRMLLGREAMKGKFIVDPEKHFQMGKHSEDEVKKLYNVHKVAAKKLRIALLASNPELYSNKRIIEAGEYRGHEMIFVNIQQCYMNVSSESSAVHYRGGEALYDIDAVIPRVKPAVTAYGCAVLRHFEHLGAFCLNDALAISRSRDKLRALQTMVAKGIDIPITGFADSPLDTKDLIKMVGGAPLVIKLLEGTQGKGVVLADTMSAAESVINALKSLKANILVQEFIKEADGKDLRCFVIDGKVVGAIERKAKKGEFRANLHLGGTATEAKVSAEEKRMAIKAAKGLNLLVAGVDIIRSKSGPRILEVNSSPGLQGIETYTGKDIAGMMIESIENQFE